MTNKKQSLVAKAERIMPCRFDTCGTYDNRMADAWMRAEKVIALCKQYFGSDELPLEVRHHTEFCFLLENTRKRTKDDHAWPSRLAINKMRLKQSKPAL